MLPMWNHRGEVPGPPSPEPWARRTRGVGGQRQGQYKNIVGRGGFDPKSASMVAVIVHRASFTLEARAAEHRCARVLQPGKVSPGAPMRSFEGGSTPI